MKPRVEALEAGRISVGGLPAAIDEALRRRLTVPNPKYVEAKLHGRWTDPFEPELFYYENAPAGRLLIPRGAVGMLQSLCESAGVALTHTVATTEASPVDFGSRIERTSVQASAVEQRLAHH